MADVRTPWGAWPSLADALGRGGRSYEPAATAGEVQGGSLTNFYRLDESDPYHLEVAELDGVIVQTGQPCELRRGLRCPCQPESALGARPSCESCGGLGFLYPAEHREPEIRILISGRNESATPEVAGFWQKGRVQLTFPSRIIPSYGDLILPQNTPHVVQERIQHRRRAIDPRTLAAAQEDRLFTPPPQTLADDRLLYPDVEAVEAIAWTLADQTVRMGTLGVDFDLVGNRIRWRPNRGPEAGAMVSIRYRAPAAYLVQGDVAPRTENGARLPYRCSGIALDRLGTPDLRDQP